MVQGVVFNARLWDVKPDKYLPGRFWVFCGTDHFDAMVISSVDDIISVCPDSLKSKNSI